MAASEEIDKHVLKKYEVQQKLGKGVSGGGLSRARARKRAAGGRFGVAHLHAQAHAHGAAPPPPCHNTKPHAVPRRPMALCGARWTKSRARRWR